MPIKRIAAAIAAAIAACVVCHAQVTFRSGSTLIELTVVATNAKGEAVTDLRKEEVVVEESKLARPVAVFRFEGTAAASQQPAPQPPPEVFTNRAEFNQGTPRNVTAILLDSLNSLPSDIISARDQVLTYVGTMESGTRVAV